MTTHQTDLNGYTNLNDAHETNSNAHFSSKQRNFEEEQSNAHHRSSASENEASNPVSGAQDNTNTSNQSQDQPQGKELNPIKSFLYKALLVYFCLSNVKTLLMELGVSVPGVEFNKFARAWFIVLCVIAFIGLWNKDLAKIEKAFTMLKIHFPLLVISHIGGFFDIIALEQRYGSRNGSFLPEALKGMVLGLVYWVLFMFLPLRDVRNTWRPVSQEEKARKEQVDPIEKLDSLKFTIYKYALLICFCLDLKWFISDVYGDFSDFPKHWGKMMSSTSYLVWQFYFYLFSPLSLFATPFAFEGLRTKNLKKILTSITLIKVRLVMELIFHTLYTCIKYYLKETYEADEEIEDDDMFINFLMSTLMIILLHCIFIYFTSQVRDILKAHQKARHTL